MEEYIINKDWGVDEMLFHKIRNIVLKHLRNEMLINVHLGSCPFNGNKQRIFVPEFYNDDRETCIPAIEGAIDDIDIVVYRFENTVVYSLKEDAEALAGI